MVTSAGQVVVHIDAASNFERKGRVEKILVGEKEENGVFCLRFLCFGEEKKRRDGVLWIKD